MDIVAVASALNKHGIRPSHPRLQIYDFLWKNRIHPTVETIYSRLFPGNPSLSKMTVYNVMKLFVEKGVVEPIVIEENEVRYDIDKSFHGHFKCSQCGAIHDIKISKPVNVDASLPEGFISTHSHLYYFGICRTCANQDRPS